MRQQRFTATLPAEPDFRATLAEGIPIPGPEGPTGLAATITIGVTTTGPPGSSAVVTNTGTPSAAILDFTIPQGPIGPPGFDDPTTTLGDLMVRGSTTVARLAIGSDGQVLTADSTEPLGVRWAAGLSLDANGNLALPNLPQYADLATAQAALGAGTKILWCDPSNAVFVT